MKNLILMVGLLAASTQAFAAGTKTMDCNTEDGSTRVEVIENRNGTMVALVTVEASGGGLPTFKFKIHETRVPTAYLGDGFELAIDSNEKWYVNAPSLGIESEDIVCN